MKKTIFYLFLLLPLPALAHDYHSTYKQNNKCYGNVYREKYIQGNIKKQTNQAMKATKDGKIPKKFGKLRALGKFFGWVDAPIEFMFAAPHLMAGDIEGAKRATTAGLFGWGKVDLDKISDKEAQRYLKHTKAMNDYFDNYGRAIDAEANLDNLNKLPEGVQTEKKFMFNINIMNNV